MNYDLINQLGFGYIDFSYLFIGLAAAILILLIIILVQAGSIRKLNKKYQKFMLGKDGKSLESNMMKLFEEQTILKETVTVNKKDIRELFKKLEGSFQKVGIVRYDAYQQMGGMLSFSLALLDEKNDGFILNSVHSIDGCYTYTKEIKNGKCKIELGNEEKVALDQAMGTEE